jgi:hypothetical protein
MSILGSLDEPTASFDTSIEHANCLIDASVTFPGVE